VDRSIEYQPKGGDALRLGSKGRYGSYPLVTHGSYLSALNMLYDKVLYKFKFTLLHLLYLQILFLRSMSAKLKPLDAVKSSDVI